MGRAIGIDVGTKTIGVAISDHGRRIASPVCTVKRKGVKQDVVALQRICAERGEGEVDAVVVGLPLELDDSEKRSARLARQVGEALGEALGIPPTYVDERYSSVDAERSLIESDLSRKRRKQVIDQAAAVLILQSWLDHGDFSQIS